MPGPTAVIGGTATVYVPDDTTQIALGYTEIRIYWAASETASASLATTLTLVSGTFDYTYNKTDALATDWFYWALYGATPGEGPASERVPIGPTRSTRLAIRQGVGQLLRLMDGPYALATAATASLCTISALIDPDASAHRLTNRFVRCSGGTAIGQTRRTRTAANSGYIPATGTLTLGRATSPAWVAADSVEIWRAKGDEDLSVLIDQAMNTTAPSIYIEDSFYLTIDDSVSEYYLPQGIGELNTLGVDWVRDSYPSKPDWRPVGFFDFATDGGSTILTVKRAAIGPSYYSQGDIIRVRYASNPDNMDSDTDYWAIPLEWAVAEVAMTFLDTIATPSGGLEQIVDAERAKAALRRNLDTYRGRWMPRVQMKVIMPR